jgi:Xaa-Pro aminopeptidase
MRHAPIDPALFTAHRRGLTDLLPAHSLAIVHAADVLPATGDGTLPLHPAADLFWRTDEHLATWEGEKLSAERARATSGVAKVRWLDDLSGALHQLMAQAETVFLVANEHERGAIDVDSRDLRMARQLQARYPLHRYARLTPLLRRLRAVKDETEVELIRQAIDITAAGLRRLAAAVRPGVMEHELEAELIHEFTRRRARMAYEPIIAAGRNACVLHYTDNDKVCSAGDLVLVDVGASYANYCADLTRTFPVGGRFSPRQREVYDAVLRVLRHSIARATVGTTLRDWKRAAQVEMTQELVGLGLVSPTDAARDSGDEPACRRFFMHGIGHSLGLGVHDLAPPDGPLAPGWVLTVEPGIYIPEERIGIRLENDILITADGPVDLCSQVPLEAEEIESLSGTGR